MLASCTGTPFDLAIFIFPFILLVSDLLFCQAGQAALKAYDKATKVVAKRERYKSNRNALCQKGKTWEQQAKTLEAEVDRLKKELADARTAADVAEAEAGRVKEEEKEKLRAAYLKGYEAGIKRAAMEYTKVSQRMVNDELEMRLPDFFKLGYAAGAEAMAKVMVTEPESGIFRQLLEPDVPDLELPYTEEECQPLPPEDDEDEEMLNGAEAEQLGGTGENVAEDGDHNKSAEAETQDKVAEDEIYVQID